MGEVRRIMQVCACLWGGAFNPIIPVYDETPGSMVRTPSSYPRWHRGDEGLSRLLRARLFVESETGLATRAGIADLKLTYGEPSVFSLDDFFDPTDTRRSGQPRVPLGLTILDVYQELYDRQFQFVRRHDSRVVAFDSSPEHDAFIEAAFGGFPDRGYLSSLASAYREAFDPLRFQATPEVWTRIAKESYATPLRFTMNID